MNAFVLTQHKGCNKNRLLIVVRSFAFSYRQETPTRFKKELVAAAFKSAEKDHVGPEDFEHVLSNIGVIDRLNKGDLSSIFQQAGNRTGKISASQLYQIL